MHREWEVRPPTPVHPCPGSGTARSKERDKDSSKGVAAGDEPRGRGLADGDPTGDEARRRPPGRGQLDGDRRDPGSTRLLAEATETRPEVTAWQDRPGRCSTCPRTPGETDGGRWPGGGAVGKSQATGPPAKEARLPGPRDTNYVQPNSSGSGKPSQLE